MHRCAGCVVILTKRARSCRSLSSLQGMLPGQLATERPVPSQYFPSSERISWHT